MNIDETDISCKGSSDGKISILGTSSVFDSYQLYKVVGEPDFDEDPADSGTDTPEGSAISDASTGFSGLGAGSYYVIGTVDSSNQPGTNCTVNSGAEIIDDAAALSSTISPSAETCAGGDGTINLFGNSNSTFDSYQLYKVVGEPDFDADPNDTGSDSAVGSSVSDISTGFSGLSAGSYYLIGTVDSTNQPGTDCTAISNVSIINGPTNCSHLFPTGTDCSDYLDPTIVDNLVLEEVCLTTSSGMITNGTPGVFFFYGDFIAVKGWNTVRVDQIVPDGMAPFSVLNENNLWIYDSNCNSQKISVEQVGEDWLITFRARDAGQFVVSVKYDAKSLIGTSAPGGVENYIFGIDGVGASYGSIAVRDCSAASSSIQATSMEEPETQSINVEAVVENEIAVYPNPFSDVINVKYDINYTSDVVIEIFDFGGNLLRKVTDKGVSSGSVTSINVDFSIGANQMYVVRVSTDSEVFVKQIVSKK